MSNDQDARASERLWLRERAPVHDVIVAAHLVGKQPEDEARPVAYFSAGGGASGRDKARFDVRGGEHAAAELADPSRGRKDIVVIDQSRIKQLLPEFQLLRGAGDTYAALGVRAEAASIARRVLDEVQRRRLSYLCYTTGASPRFMDHLVAACVPAYTTQVVMTSRPTNEAIARSLLRGNWSPTNQGRFANVDELKKGHFGASRNLEHWKDSVWVGSWRLYDTSQGMPSDDELGDTPENWYMDVDEDDSFIDLPSPHYEGRTPDEDSAAVDQLLEQHQAGQIELPQLPPLTDDA